MTVHFLLVTCLYSASSPAKNGIVYSLSLYDHMFTSFLKGSLMTFYTFIWGECIERYFGITLISVMYTGKMGVSGST